MTSRRPKAFWGAGATPGRLLALGAVLLVGGLGGPAARATDGRGSNRAERALSVLRDGAEALHGGRIARACDGFRRAVELTPTWGMARLELGRCLRLLGRPGEEAGRHLERALELLPERAVVRAELGRRACDRGRPEAARQWFQRALDRDPGRDGVRDALAGAIPETPTVATLERLRALTERRPAEVAAWRLRARVAEALGNLDEARRALERAVELARGPEAAAALGRFGRRHDRPEAVARARGALEQVELQGAGAADER